MSSWVTGVFLALCSIKDIRHKEVSLKVISVFFGLGFIWRLFGGSAEVGQAVMGMSLGIAVLGIGYLTKEAIGYGDGLAVGVIGVWLGFLHTLEVLFLALFISSCAAAIIIVVKRPGKKYQIPFVPFLLLGWIVWTLSDMKQVM